QHGHHGQYRYELVLVWRQYARHRPAFLRLHGFGLQVAHGLRREPGGAGATRPHAAEILDEFQASAGRPTARARGRPEAETVARGRLTIPFWHSMPNGGPPLGSTSSLPTPSQGGNPFDAMSCIS